MFDIHCVLWCLVITETGTNGRWWLTCKTDLGCSPNSFSNLMWNCSRSMWIFYNKEWPVRLACLLHVWELMLNLLQTTPKIHLTQPHCEFTIIFECYEISHFVSIISFMNFSLAEHDNYESCLFLWKYFFVEDNFKIFALMSMHKSI